MAFWRDARRPGGMSLARQSRRKAVGLGVGYFAEMGLGLALVIEVEDALGRFSAISTL